jgi:cysteine desulfurase
MTAVLREHFGNPSSTHAEGAAAKRLVEDARAEVAALLGAAPGEVFFTGGATEANNAVLQGLFGHGRPGAGARRIVTSQVEHPSVVEPCQILEDEQRAGVTRVGVDEDGRLDRQAFREAIDAADVGLASLIWANNETGVVLPMAEIASETARAGVPLHVDATQGVGKIPIDLREVRADFLACSAHKLGGPKGVGALVVRGEHELPPLLAGGPQERRRRGGTENVAGIVGFGEACRLAREELGERQRRYAELRDRLWEGLQKQVPDLRRNGAPESVLPNTLNVEFRGAPGEIVLQALDLEGVAASAGAACHSGAISPSHVLSAMGRSPEEARSALRLSVGHGVDEAQVDRAVALLAELVERARRVGTA